MSLADQSAQFSPVSARVSVLQARGLQIKGKDGTNDVYTALQAGRESFRTQVSEKRADPVWGRDDAAFIFTLPSEQEDVPVHVRVMHRVPLGADKLLGLTDISVHELRRNGARDNPQWYKLLNKAGKADKERGEILLDIQFLKSSMSASMTDLSDKSHSRLGKFKDKLRGKKKDGLSDSASAILPSVNQVLTDSEGEMDGEIQGESTKKKKNKLKSLFVPKTNMKRNSLSQSMSSLGTLPEKNTPSANLPSVSHVLTDSEGEMDGETEGDSTKKKRNKLKSLFVPKPSLKRNSLSQSMSSLGTLPEKNSASANLPSVSPVVVDSEGEMDKETEGDSTKKKNKLKSLFVPKPNLKRNSLSHSTSSLGTNPDKNSASGNLPSVSPVVVDSEGEMDGETEGDSTKKKNKLKSFFVPKPNLKRSSLSHSTSSLGTNPEKNSTSANLPSVSPVLVDSEGEMDGETEGDSTKKKNKLKSFFVPKPNLKRSSLSHSTSSLGTNSEKNSASANLPSVSPVVTDSEGEMDGETEGDSTKKKKKNRLKSLFLPKSNLKHNSLSQSTSSLGTLPAKNSSVSSSTSSGLNVESLEGKKKKKFSFLPHKRNGSTDSKASTHSDFNLGSTNQIPPSPIDIRINGSDVYREEIPCEKVHELKVEEETRWRREEEEQERLEEERRREAEEERKRKEREEQWRKEEEEDERIRKERELEEQMRRIEEEENKRRMEREMEGEKRRMDEENERNRMERELEEQRRRLEEEEKNRTWMEEEEKEQIRMEREFEEQRRLEEEEKERIRMEEDERRRRLEEEEQRKRIEEEEEAEELRRKMEEEEENERKKAEEEDKRWIAEEERMNEEKKQAERQRIMEEEETRFKMEKRLADEKKVREEEERRIAEEMERQREEEERVRKEIKRKEKEQERLNKETEEKERLRKEEPLFEEIPISQSPDFIRSARIFNIKPSVSVSATVSQPSVENIDASISENISVKERTDKKGHAPLPPQFTGPDLCSTEIPEQPSHLNKVTKRPAPQPPSTLRMIREVEENTTQTGLGQGAYRCPEGHHESKVFSAFQDDAHIYTNPFLTVEPVAIKHSKRPAPKPGNAMSMSENEPRNGGKNPTESMVHLEEKRNASNSKGNPPNWKLMRSPNGITVEDGKSGLSEDLSRREDHLEDIVGPESAKPNAPSDDIWDLSPEHLACKTAAFPSIKRPQKKSQAPLPPAKPKRIGDPSMLHQQPSFLNETNLAQAQENPHNKKDQDNALGCSGEISAISAPSSSTVSSSAFSPLDERSQVMKLSAAKSVEMGSGAKTLPWAKVVPNDAGEVRAQVPTSVIRKQAVKPLSAAENQAEIPEFQMTDNTQPKTKAAETVMKGPYSQLTQPELVSLALHQQEQISKLDARIKELEGYIDNLLVRVIEEQPSILMAMNTVNKSV